MTASYNGYCISIYGHMGIHVTRNNLMHYTIKRAHGLANTIDKCLVFNTMLLHDSVNPCNSF